MKRQAEQSETRYSSRVNIALLIFLSIGGYFLATEHLAHTIQALPFVLLLIFLGVHIYLHWGNDSSGSSGDNDCIEPRGDNHGG